jgi:hypothetical protein
MAIGSPIAPARAADDTAPPPALAEPPDEVAQANAAKLIHDLYGTQIDSAKTAFAKDELAKKLLQQGIDSKADPAGQFVLLKMARDLALSVGDAVVALRSVDETAQAFRLDALALRQEALSGLAKTATNPQQSRALADADWSALDDAIAADNFEVAKLLAAQGLAAAKRAKDNDVLRQWTARGKEIEGIESAYETVRPAATKLEQKPLDPAANATVGRYIVFTKGDWDTGLPMIALGAESPLQVLAVAEMSPPAEPEAQLKLADGWWDLADGTADAGEKERLQGRALFWYGTALPNLSGLPKAKVEKRLQDITGKAFTRVQAAMRANKVMFTPAVGPTNRGAPFIDRPDEGGLLVGFEIGLGNTNDGSQYIRTIRPIFLTSHGEIQGSMHGMPRGDAVTVRAREGFAVGGLTLKASNRIDGLSVTFMQIQGIGLNPRDAYVSDWYGSRTSAISKRIGGSGSPMIGIGGKSDNSLQEIALLQTK